MMFTKVDNEIKGEPYFHRATLNTSSEDEQEKDVAGFGGEAG